MDIKKEYLVFFVFLIVILFLNSVKNRYNENRRFLEDFREKESRDGEKKSINGSKNNNPLEYEFLGGNNPKSNIQSNNLSNHQNNSQNENEMNGYMDHLPERDRYIKKSSNSSYVDKSPEVIQNSGKLVVEISQLLKKCKKEEKITEKIIKDNIKTIKTCIKQDLKYKQIAKNYDEAIRILSENIEVCEGNTYNTLDLDRQVIDRNLADLIDEIY